MNDVVRIILYLALCWKCCFAMLPSLGLLGPPDNGLIRVRNLDDPNLPKHKHAVLDFVGLVEQYGYPAEEYQITTTDGYKLKLHRVPGSPSSPKASGKPVVYLQHGVAASSDIYVLLGPDISIVYVLADAGYDVWVGNVRGNSYGRSHVTLSPDNDEEFWNFSYHEAAVVDIAAIIDFILNKTGEPSLIYYGQSMGTTVSFVLLSEKPEYNKKIRLVLSLAPVAFWRHKFSPFLKILLKNSERILNFINSGPYYEAFPQSSLNLVLVELCRDGSILQSFCFDLLDEVNGANHKQLNSSFVPTVLQHFPMGSSVKTFIHYFQNMITGTFRQFDYGKARNLELYNNTIPPDYNLTNIMTPVALFYGDNDLISLSENLKELLERLPNIVVCENIEGSKFNHFDFVSAIDLKRLLHDRVLRIMDNFPVGVTYTASDDLTKNRLKRCRV